jgi:hypothetical protein
MSNRCVKVYLAGPVLESGSASFGRLLCRGRAEREEGSLEFGTPRMPKCFVNDLRSSKNR